MKNQINLRFTAILLVIVLVTISRVIPHMPNFSPMNSICLFAGAYFINNWQKFLVPLLCIWLSDMYITNVIYGRFYDEFVWFYGGFYWQYATYALIVIISLFSLKKIKPTYIIGSALSVSILFFLITNFGVWVSGNMYPKTIQGLIACYVAGIPFLKGTLLGDLFYSAIMFGTFEFAQSKIKKLQIQL